MDQSVRRCIARTRKEKSIWKTGFSNHSFGVQCRRPASQGKNTCSCHTNLPFGIYQHIELPSNFVIDLDDSTYEFLQKHHLNKEEYKNSGKTIIAYLKDFIIQNKGNVPDYLLSDNIEHQEYVLGMINNRTIPKDISRTQFDKIYNSIMRDILYQPKILNWIVQTSLSYIANDNEAPKRQEKVADPETSNEKKKVSDHYIHQQEWWAKQHKIQITDYDTKKRAVFAIDHQSDGDAVILTKAKVKVGKCSYWKDNRIPDEFKNGNEVVICPFGKYYLSHIQLFAEMKHFHNLPKAEYFEYEYDAMYNILRKTHELVFL